MTTTSGNIATTPMGFLMNAPPPWPYSGGNPQDVPLAIIRGKKKKKRVLVTALEEGRQSRLKAERKAARAAAKAGADAPAATPAKAASPPPKAAKEAPPKAAEPKAPAKADDSKPETTKGWKDVEIEPGVWQVTAPQLGVKKEMGVWRTIKGQRYFFPIDGKPPVVPPLKGTKENPPNPPEAAPEKEADKDERSVFQKVKQWTRDAIDWKRDTEYKVGRKLAPIIVGAEAPEFSPLVDKLIKMGPEERPDDLIDKLTDKALGKTSAQQKLDAKNAKPAAAGSAPTPDAKKSDQVADQAAAKAVDKAVDKVADKAADKAAAKPSDALGDDGKAPEGEEGVSVDEKGRKRSAKGRFVKGAGKAGAAGASEGGKKEGGKAAASDGKEDDDSWATSAKGQQLLKNLKDALKGLQSKRGKKVSSNVVRGVKLMIRGLESKSKIVYSLGSKMVDLGLPSKKNESVEDRVLMLLQD